MKDKRKWSSPLLALALLMSGCVGSQVGSQSTEPQLTVQLKVNSLLAKSVQEKNSLGTADGDELTLVYAINAYDANGNLLSVNNGFWGTRTITEGTTIPAAEFDQIQIKVPKNGSIIAALSLLEIDDYKGERQIGKVRAHTKSERQPKMMTSSTLSADQHLPPIELISKSLRIAGYNNFMSRHLTLSLNDDLGGIKKVLEASDLAKIQTGAESGQSTFEMNGQLVNESFFYVLKYDLDVKGP